MNNNQQPLKVKQDIWERSGLLWGILFYALLFVPAAIAVFDEELPVSGRLQVLALTVVLAGWHAGLLYFIKHNPDFRKRPLPILLYISLVLLLWTRLTIIHPVFYIMLFILYGLIFGILTLRYAIPISLILSGLIIYVQVVESGLPFRLNTPLILIYGAMAGAAIIFALWINSIINQSIQRRQLIEELQQTQAELAEAERHAGKMDERQRLARDIHDTLAQGFTSIVMQLEAAEQSLPEGNTTTQHHISQARQIARNSLEQARRVVQDLRPDLLEQKPLHLAIERVSKRWATQSGIAATATTTGTAVQLHPQIEVTLLRATQEALNNIHKHAQAQNAAVTLSYMDDVIVLDVQDDGVGLSSGAASDADLGGFGLTAMRERVKMLNGSLLVESTPEEGTTLVIEIPLENDA